MTPETRAEMLEEFRKGEACEDCGGLHSRKCPRVKRRAFHPNGNLVEVEYWPDGSYDSSTILWPEDLFEEDD
jgi:hypothetical protein